jgi:hypothetical protein
MAATPGALGICSSSQSGGLLFLTRLPAARHAPVEQSDPQKALTQQGGDTFWGGSVPRPERALGHLAGASGPQRRTFFGPPSGGMLTGTRGAPVRTCKIVFKHSIRQLCSSTSTSSYTR